MAQDYYDKEVKALVEAHRQAVIARANEATKRALEIARELDLDFFDPWDSEPPPIEEAPPPPPAIEPVFLPPPPEARPLTPEEVFDVFPDPPRAPAAALVLKRKR